MKYSALFTFFVFCSLSVPHWMHPGVNERKHEPVLILQQKPLIYKMALAAVVCLTSSALFKTAEARWCGQGCWEECRPYMVRAIAPWNQGQPWRLLGLQHCECKCAPQQKPKPQEKQDQKPV